MIKRFYQMMCVVFVITACKGPQFLLPDELNEISGIEQISEDLFVSINDSGDGPFLYFFNSVGEIKHKMFVSGANNIDWEDITYDGKYVYVGDIGNNLNNRRDLTIYKIVIDTTLRIAYEGVDSGSRLRDTAEAIKYTFEYPDQENYPPTGDKLNFDSEALTCARGSILILTKSRTKPFKPVSKVYLCTLDENKIDLSLPVEIKLEGKSWIGGSVTSCDFTKDRLYVLTYRHIYIYQLEDFQFKLEQKIRLGRLQQWEGICVDSEEQIRIVAEKSRLGKQKMRTIKL